MAMTKLSYSHLRELPGLDDKSSRERDEIGNPQAKQETISVP
jgi:hypothetical protein